MGFDGKSSKPSAMSHKESYYHEIETRHLFTPDTEKDCIQQISFKQFNDQASAILRVR